MVRNSTSNPWSIFFTNSLLELKTFTLMAKFELKFLDFFGFHYIKVEKKTKELYTKDKEVITVTISDYNNTELFINLDKSTAIKFAKTLRTEINKITESEVNLG